MDDASNFSVFADVHVKGPRRTHNGPIAGGNVALQVLLVLLVLL